jgi:hypothetical protein
VTLSIGLATVSFKRDSAQVMPTMVEERVCSLPWSAGSEN